MENIIHYCSCCGTKYSCPCKSCYPNGNALFSFEGGDYIRCNTCGHSDHIDEWEKLSFQQFEEQELANDED